MPVQPCTAPRTIITPHTDCDMHAHTRTCIHTHFGAFFLLCMLAGWLACWLLTPTTTTIVTVNAHSFRFIVGGVHAYHSVLVRVSCLPSVAVNASCTKQKRTPRRDVCGEDAAIMIDHRLCQRCAALTYFAIIGPRGAHVCYANHRYCLLYTSPSPRDRG